MEMRMHAARALWWLSAIMLVVALLLAQPLCTFAQGEYKDAHQVSTSPSGQTDTMPSPDGPATEPEESPPNDRDHNIFDVAQLAIQASTVTLYVFLGLLAAFGAIALFGLWGLYRKTMQIDQLRMEIGDQLKRLKDETKDELGHLEKFSEFSKELARHLPPIIAPGIDDEAKRTAIFTLAQQRNPELLDLFAGLLKKEDVSPSVRIAAVYALGMIGPAAKETLPEVLVFCDNPDKSMVIDAIRAIVRIGHLGRGVETKLQELKSHDDAEVRERASQALDKLKNQDQNQLSP